MKHIPLTLAAAAVAVAAHAQSLYNNAMNAGLTQEGLRTDARSAGGSYSMVQQGNMLAGFRCSMTGAAADRIADDFTVPLSGWHLTGATFYVYQQSVSQVSILGGIFEVRQKLPLGLVGAKVASGSLANVYWTDIYRIFTNRYDDTRRLQKVKVTFDASLSPGDYYLVWAMVGTQPQTGPWQPYLTKKGSQTVPGANGMQSSDGGLTWFLVEDGLLHQDFPFMLSGTQTLAEGTGTPMSPP
ncbi:MAG: hypothetical protein JSS66_18400 [Armatimonadetes bacterium]|nr:hypothetical protein [Armatimonadota bacterium]